jgi:transcriptional regulator with XRE-family HTH domain
MTQTQLGDAIDMAQTWVSKLENPEYGKMAVATLLRLAVAFDTDLEIKFRPFSKTLDSLTTQGSDYFFVPSFEDEFGSENLAPEDLAKVHAIEDRLKPTRDQQPPEQPQRVSTLALLAESRDPSFGSVPEPLAPRKTVGIAATVHQEQYGTCQGTTR